jgi:hypothetical protein
VELIPYLEFYAMMVERRITRSGQGRIGSMASESINHDDTKTTKSSVLCAAVVAQLFSAPAAPRHPAKSRNCLPAQS